MTNTVTLSVTRFYYDGDGTRVKKVGSKGGTTVTTAYAGPIEVTITGSVVYIFVDCPPRLDVFSINALVAAVLVAIPFVPEPLPELTLGDVSKAIRQVRLLQAGQGTLEVRGFIPNRVNRRHEALTRDVLNRLPPGIPALPTIRDSAYISRAPPSGKTVFQVTPNSQAADEYRHLSQDLANGIA